MSAQEANDILTIEQKAQVVLLKKGRLMTSIISGIISGLILLVGFSFREGVKEERLSNTISNIQKDQQRDEKVAEDTFVKQAAQLADHTIRIIVLEQKVK